MRLTGQRRTNHHGCFFLTTCHAPMMPLYAYDPGSHKWHGCFSTLAFLTPFQLGSMKMTLEESLIVPTSAK